MSALVSFIGTTTAARSGRLRGARLHEQRLVSFGRARRHYREMLDLGNIRNPPARGGGGPEGMHQRHAQARLRHGEGRWGTRPARPADGRPSATAGNDRVGERRGRRQRDELREFEGTRVPPGGGGALGGNRSSPSCPGRYLGSVGERQPDRWPPSRASRSRSNLPWPKSSPKPNGGRYDRSIDARRATRSPRQGFTDEQTGTSETPGRLQDPAARRTAPPAPCNY